MHARAVVDVTVGIHGLVVAEGETGRGIAIQCRDAGGQLARLHEVIGVEERNVIGACVPNPHVARLGGSAMSRYGDDGDTRIGDGAYHVNCAIGRAVIDHDDFDIVACAVQRRAHRGHDVALGIVRRHHH